MLSFMLYFNLNSEKSRLKEDDCERLSFWINQHGLIFHPKPLSRVASS